MLPNRNIFYLSFLSAMEIGEKAPFVTAEIIIGNGGEEVAPFKAPFPRFLSLSLLTPRPRLPGILGVRNTTVGIHQALIPMESS